MPYDLKNLLMMILMLAAAGAVFIYGSRIAGKLATKSGI